METSYEKLKFRRQFLISRSPVVMFTEWQCLQIGPFYLYTHPDLEVNHIRHLDKSIVLIGSIYDPSVPEKGNADILKDIIADTGNEESFFLRIKRYAGIYAFLYLDDKKNVILNDALALREIYYCSMENQIICGSQPNLLAKYAKPEIGPRTDQPFLEYYLNHSENSRWNPRCKWIGDETYYKGIRHLLPNHFLDINKCEVQRYWPNESIKKISLADAVSKSCSFLQGSMRALASRHSVMMAVTAGTDSRTLLAASKDIKDKVYYFVNRQNLAPDHPDILLPKKIFESLDVPFHVHNVPTQVDNRFRQTFLANTFFASERLLPTIYNVYFKGLSDKVNILGIGEIGRTRFGKEPKKLNSYRIAYKMKYKKSRYAIEQGERILAELLPVGKRYGLNTLTLLYWEHWLGNWGATGNSESDIAIEEIDPLDSHMLYEILLGVDEKYTRYYNPKIFKEMIRTMWQDLAKWPINPPYKFQDQVGRYLKKAGLYSILKEIKYQANYLRYRLNAILKSTNT